MRFLYPSGGDVDVYGYITTPGHLGIPIGIKNNKPWAADNQAFKDGFNADVFFPWLETMIPYRDNCLFVSCPDKIGDAEETLKLFEQWKGSFLGWPLAFVAQDGQEGLPFPSDGWSTLFVGGSTKWKESEAAISAIKQAQLLGRHIHIGRVNWRRRYQMFAMITGSEDFTCDGTRPRYDGTEKTIEAWNGYREKTRVLKLW